MFVRNKTKFSPVLSRGSLSDEVDVGAIVVELRFRVVGERLEPMLGSVERVSTDPPDIHKIPMWRGTSVTAAGDVLGPSRPPFLRPVTLSVGREIRRIVAFGNRRWESSVLGELTATDPAPFDSLPLSFERAFGGSFVLPPGLLPGTDLPHPGGKVPYYLNERGIGFYADEAAAIGGLLPNFELADQLVTRWSDRPVPGCFVPCPELVALRLRDVRVDLSLAKPEDATTSAFQARFASRAFFMVQHHAPGYLVFDAFPSGTAIQLQGLGTDAVRFEVPACPARVTLRRGQSRTEVDARVRSVHVDAARRLITCVYGSEFYYNESTAPSWITIES